MNRKLYVIGDSFSNLYSYDPNTDSPYIRYKNFRGGNLPYTWSELLSKKIGYQLINLSVAGASNYEIFDQFCDVSQTIKKDDLLFIGWTDTMRFRLYSDKTNRFEKINIKGDRKLHFSNISENTFNEILVNRSHIYWVTEISKWELVINKLSELIGFEYHIWTFFYDYSDYNILPTLISRGATIIKDETNGLIDDLHFAEMGHIVQSEYFFEKLKNI